MTQMPTTNGSPDSGTEYPEGFLSGGPRSKVDPPKGFLKETSTTQVTYPEGFLRKDTSDYTKQKPLRETGELLGKIAARSYERSIQAVMGDNMLSDLVVRGAIAFTRGVGWMEATRERRFGDESEAALKRGFVGAMRPEEQPNWLVGDVESAVESLPVMGTTVAGAALGTLVGLPPQAGMFIGGAAGGYAASESRSRHQAELQIDQIAAEYKAAGLEMPMGQIDDAIDKTAKLSALIEAGVEGLSGAITGGIGSLLIKRRISKEVGRQVSRKYIKSLAVGRAAKVTGAFAAGAAIEGLEEVVTEIGQSFVDVDPRERGKFTVGELARAWRGGVLGGTFIGGGQVAAGAAAGKVVKSRREKQEKQLQERIKERLIGDKNRVGKYQSDFEDLSDSEIEARIQLQKDIQDRLEQKREELRGPEESRTRDEFDNAEEISDIAKQIESQEDHILAMEQAQKNLRDGVAVRTVEVSSPDQALKNNDLGTIAEDSDSEAQRAAVRLRELGFEVVVVQPADAETTTQAFFLESTPDTIYLNDVSIEGVSPFAEGIHEGVHVVDHLVPELAMEMREILSATVRRQYAEDYTSKGNTGRDKAARARLGLRSPGQVEGATSAEKRRLRQGEAFAELEGTATAIGMGAEMLEGDKGRISAAIDKVAARLGFLGQEAKAAQRFIESLKAMNEQRQVRSRLKPGATVTLRGVGAELDNTALESRREGATRQSIADSYRNDPKLNFNNILPEDSYRAIVEMNIDMADSSFDEYEDADITQEQLVEYEQLLSSGIQETVAMDEAEYEKELEQKEYERRLDIKYSIAEAVGDVSESLAQTFTENISDLIEEYDGEKDFDLSRAQTDSVYLSISLKNGNNIDIRFADHGSGIQGGFNPRTQERHRAPDINIAFEKMENLDYYEGMTSEQIVASLSPVLTKGANALRRNGIYDQLFELIPGLVDESTGSDIRGLQSRRGENTRANQSRLNRAEADSDLLESRRRNPAIQQLAATYSQNRGLAYNPDEEAVYAEVDLDRAKAIADEFDALPEMNLDDPETREAYRAMADETVEQYEFLEQSGVNFVPWAGVGEPYINSQEMIEDVKNNNRLFYFKTINPQDPETFGEDVAQYIENGHPLFEEYGDPVPDSNGDMHQQNVNDLFRAVHDYFGHAKEGFQFGPRGEENAWRVHSQMYSPMARRAMTTETRGQNSWVNFGPHMRREDGTLPVAGEPDFVPLSKRRFADQKVALLPEQYAMLDEEVEAGVTALESRRANTKKQVDEVLAAVKADTAREVLENTESDILKWMDPEEARGFSNKKTAREAIELYEEFISDRKLMADSLKILPAASEWYILSEQVFSALGEGKIPLWKLVAVIATTSAQKSVKSNVKVGLQTANAYVEFIEAGGDVNDTEALLQAIANPTTGNSLRDDSPSDPTGKMKRILSGGKGPLYLYADVLGTADVLQSQTIDEVIERLLASGSMIKEQLDLSKGSGSARKLASFLRNLMGDDGRVTNDVWMALWWGIDQSNFSSAKGYTAATAAMRNIAASVGMSPAEGQAAAWALARVYLGRIRNEKKRSAGNQRKFADVIAEPVTIEDLLGEDIGSLLVLPTLTTGGKEVTNEAPALLRSIGFDPDAARDIVEGFEQRYREAYSGVDFSLPGSLGPRRAARLVRRFERADIERNISENVKRTKAGKDPLPVTQLASRRDGDKPKKKTKSFRKMAEEEAFSETKGEPGNPARRKAFQTGFQYGREEQQLIREEKEEAARERAELRLMMAADRAEKKLARTVAKLGKQLETQKRLADRKLSKAAREADRGKVRAKIENAIRKTESEFRENGRRLVNLLPRVERGRLLNKLDRVKDAESLMDFGQEVSRIAHYTRYMDARNRLTKVERVSRRPGMTNEVREQMEEKLAEAQAVIKPGDYLKPQTESPVLKAAFTRANELLDQAMILYTDDRADFRQMKDERAQRLEMDADQIVASLPTKVIKKKKATEKRREGVIKKTLRLGGDLEALTKAIDPSGTLHQYLYSSLIDAESKYLNARREIQEKMESAAVEAGFNNLQDLRSKLSDDDFGSGSTETRVVVIDGEKQTINLGTFLKLLALDEETQELIMGNVEEDKVGVGLSFREEESDVFRMTPEEYETIRSQASPSELKLVESLKEYRESLRDPAFDVVYQLKGRQPKFVEGYEPRSRAKTAARQPEITQSSAVAASFLENGGFTEERTPGGGSAVIIGDFLRDFANSTDMLVRLAHMGVEVRDANAILLDQAVKDRIVKAFGDDAHKRLINMFQVGTGIEPRVVGGSPAGAFASELTGAYSQGVLNLNPGTYSRIYAGGLARLISDVDMPLLGLARAIVNPTDLPSFDDIQQISGYFYARGSEQAIDRRSNQQRTQLEDVRRSAAVKHLKSVFTELAGGRVNNARKELQRAFGQIGLLDYLDKFIVRSAVKAHMNSGKDFDEAVRAAERSIRRTQNTTSPLDDPYALNSKGARYFLPFASDPLKAGSRLYEAVATGNANGLARWMVSSVMNAGVNVATRPLMGLIGLAVAEFLGDDEDQLINEAQLYLNSPFSERGGQAAGITIDVAEEVAGSAGAGSFLLTPIASFIARKAIGEKAYSSDIVPAPLAYQGITDIVTSIERLINSSSEETREKYMVRLGNLVSLLAVGDTTGPLRRTIFGANSYFGKYDPKRLTYIKRDLKALVKDNPDSPDAATVQDFIDRIDIVLAEKKAAANSDE